MKVAIKAFAKINPYLWVGKLREDGYHEIDAVLQAVALHDVLTFSPAPRTIVRCSDSSLDGESNLAYKAYRLASEIVDLPQLEIHIEKNIPVQAGLGGGSSDAAAALRVFDKLSQGALHRHLLEIGLACGSDVPFFLGSSTRAQATGRGDRIHALQPPAEENLVLAKPVGVACNTGDSYRRLDQIQNRPFQRPETMPYNDFERVAPRESLELLDRMRALGITKCGLCGSGSAVYGFTDESHKLVSTLGANQVWAVATGTISSFGEPWTL